MEMNVKKRASLSDGRRLSSIPNAMKGEEYLKNFLH